MNQSSTRVIAFDVRPQRLGHVILEGPTRLIDYGVARAKKSDLQADRVARLMETFHPSVVVLRSIEKGGWRDRPSLRRVMGSIRRRVRAAGTSIVHLRGATVTRALQNDAEPTKENMARLVVVQLPELTWQLPPHRKPWQPEHWRMPIFDAAALALAYFALEMERRAEAS